jgi:hypothetical protein
MVTSIWALPIAIFIVITAARDFLLAVVVEDRDLVGYGCHICLLNLDWRSTLPGRLHVDDGRSLLVRP